MQRLRWQRMSGRPVRSVLLLCWRDTGHPQGGGSEAYLQRIGAQLAASGVDVTLRTARYPGAPAARSSTGCGSTAAGGAYSIYIWAGLAMVLARIGLGPLRNGAARRGDRHPERHPVPGAPGLRSPRRRSRAPLPPRTVARRRSLDGALRLVRRVAVVAVAAPAQPVRHGVAAVGAGPDRPRRRRRARSRWFATGSTRRRRRRWRCLARTTRASRCCSRLVPHKQIEDALDAVAELRPRMPGPAPRHRRWRLVARPPRRPCAAARRLRRGDVPRPCRGCSQTRSAATELGACAAVAQGGLGPGGHRGRAARRADDRLPVLRRADRLDRRRRDRTCSSTTTTNWWSNSSGC